MAAGSPTASVVPASASAAPNCAPPETGLASLRMKAPLWASNTYTAPGNEPGVAPRSSGAPMKMRPPPAAIAHPNEKSSAAPLSVPASL